MSDFALTPDKKGFFVDVEYPEDETPRYSINLIKMKCTCMGFTMRERCKHIEEVKFRLRDAGIQFGKLEVKMKDEA